MPPAKRLLFWRSLCALKSERNAILERSLNFDSNNESSRDVPRGVLDPWLGIGVLLRVSNPDPV